MLAEQICNGLPELAKKYVWDKQAKTADECATEADSWFLGTRLCDTKPGIKANYHSMRRPNFDARANGGNKILPTESGARGLRACWTCNSHTHLSNACPENAFKASFARVVVNIMHPMYVAMKNQHLECTVHLLEMRGI